MMTQLTVNRHMTWAFISAHADSSCLCFWRIQVCSCIFSSYLLDCECVQNSLAERSDQTSLNLSSS